MSNKIRKISRIFYYAFLIILLVGCGKEFEQFTPQQPTGSLDNIYDVFGSESEEFVLPLQGELIVVTKKSSVIVIPSESLDLDNFSTIPENVTIKVKEIFTKSDMIKNNVSTRTASEILYSERMFHIDLEIDGNLINLKKGKQYKIYVPNTQPNENMELFYGITDDETIIWEEAENDESIVINEWFIQTSNGILADYGYILNCDRFDWINIDNYYRTNQDQKIEISVELPEILYNGDNTMVFMIFENENSAVRLSYNPNTNKFYEPWEGTPKGYKIKMVILSSISDNEYHYGIKSFNTEHSINTFMVPEKMDKILIEEKLKEL